MKRARVFGCCLLFLPLAGSAPQHLSGEQTRDLSAQTSKSTTRTVLSAQLRQGGVLFSKGRYAEARDHFEAVRRAASEAGETALMARATGNQGGCEFALHHYQSALKLFLEAHRLAGLAGDTSAAAAFDANIGSLYAQLGELDAAVQWLQRGLDRLSGEDRRSHLAQVQIEMAALRARQNRWDEALRLFQDGLYAADRAADMPLVAKGWQRLGEEWLRRNRLDRAEPALLEAYRVRKLNRLPLDGSYCYLGKLRLEQGDYFSASALMDRAVEAAERTQSTLPLWDVYLTRGRVRLAQNRLPEAMDDLRIALRFARAWRWSMPPDDASRVGAENNTLGQVHSAIIEAGNRLYLETGNPALIRETFEAAEENRASSLRLLVSGRRTSDPDLPPAYWEAVARLQRAEVAVLRENTSVSRQEVSAARAELVRMEAALLPDAMPLPGGLERRAREALDAGTALLGFHLGESNSWRWSLDRAGLALDRLPGRQEVATQVRQLAEAVRFDSHDANATGAALYRTLFGGLGLRFQRKTRWLLALDAGLFDAPLAAVVNPSSARVRYLIEDHTLEIIPGAGYWTESRADRSRTRYSPVFVGVGDPIYNGADSRIASPRRAGLLNIFSRTASAAGRLMLPRLVASGAELDACSRVWTGEHVLLKGADATRLRLMQQFAMDPAVLHFATHFLESAERPASGLIALTLTNRNEPELLSPAEISRWRIRAGLVVLSGCHSAAGASLPGTGLLGLTRAWLMAGAQSVIGTRWATPDDDGALFTALYQHLDIQGRSDPARALRDAQLQLLRSGGWRARPRFWGAYFVMGSA